MENKNRARVGMREEKRKEGKDPERWNKKRKEVSKDNSLASMFAKQQDVSDLNKGRDTMTSFKNKMKWGWGKQRRPRLSLEIRWSERRLYQTAKVGACTSSILGAVAM